MTFHSRLANDSSKASNIASYSQLQGAAKYLT